MPLIIVDTTTQHYALTENARALLGLEVSQKELSLQQFWDLFQGSVGVSSPESASGGEMPRAECRSLRSNDEQIRMTWADLPDTASYEVIYLERESERENLKLDFTLEALDLVPVGVCVTDPRLEDNPIVYVNQTLCDITGYSREEMVGRNCRFLQGPLSDPTTVARIHRDIDAAQPLKAVLLNHRKTGETFFNELRIFPMFDAKGELFRFIGVQHDVTLREEAVAEAERSRFISGASIAALDLRTAILDISSSSVRMSPAFAATIRSAGLKADIADVLANFAEVDRSHVSNGLSSVISKELPAWRRLVTIPGENGTAGKVVLGVSPVQNIKGEAPTQLALVILPLSALLDPAQGENNE